MVVNHTSTLTIPDLYHQGFLPQRNQKGLWYFDTSSRSNLANFQLSSENRRIINNTSSWQFTLLPLEKFELTPQTKKQLFSWTKALGWNFPISSIKTVFQNHLFNYLYLWNLPDQPPQAYALCYQNHLLCHIAYVFYDPVLAKSNLPIRLVLQAIIDAHHNSCLFCYLGGFNPITKYGFYKRTMPGFEYFVNNSWVTYHS